MEDIGKRAVEHYGEEAQQMIAVEEMSELTTALCHLRRNRIHPEHVAEEIADVLLSLESLKHIFGADRINDYFIAKQERLLARIDRDRGMP